MPMSFSLFFAIIVLIDVAAVADSGDGTAQKEWYKSSKDSWNSVNCLNRRSHGSLVQVYFSICKSKYSAG